MECYVYFSSLLKAYLLMQKFILLSFLFAVVGCGANQDAAPVAGQDELQKYADEHKDEKPSPPVEDFAL